LKDLVQRRRFGKLLKAFTKDKNLGPDGWTVEFFIHFFDLVGDELRELVEDSRIRGEVIRAINSTFWLSFPKTTNQLHLETSNP
jgi:hypothetical protein